MAALSLLACVSCFRVFLAGQFEFLHAHLEAMIPVNKRAFLSQFYSQVSGRLLQSGIKLSPNDNDKEKETSPVFSLRLPHFLSVSAVTVEACSFSN